MSRFLSDLNLGWNRFSKEPHKHWIMIKMFMYIVNKGSSSPIIQHIWIYLEGKYIH